ncbi:hypothetical protein Tco_0269380 [Tanacetum coccineum]
MPSEAFEHLIDKRKWKVIFRGCVIQFAIVDTYVPSSDCPLRDELILFILYYGYSSLLWDNLDRTHPRTIRYRVDLCVKKLYDFLFYYLLNVGVYSSLRLDTWFELVFHENFIERSRSSSSSFFCFFNLDRKGILDDLEGPSFSVSSLVRLLDVDHGGAGKGGSWVLTPDLVVMAKVGALGLGVSLFLIMERIWENWKDHHRCLPRTSIPAWPGWSACIHQPHGILRSSRRLGRIASEMEETFMGGDMSSHRSSWIKSLRAYSVKPLCRFSFEEEMEEA